MLPTSHSLRPASTNPFPPFYACYILRSLSPRPRARKTYVGSTTNPLRRLRQHNGEITQGARRTKLDRPWILSLLIYGFPTKLHALQFEWAMQHPWKSRQLRTPAGEQMFPSRIGRSLLSTRILVARTMLSHPCFRAWPLHVKLYDKEAALSWSAAGHLLPSLPKKCKLERKYLKVDEEGVLLDSSQLHLDLLDASFTDAHLSKYTRLLHARKRKLSCSVCKQPIHLASSALTTVMCTAGECDALSHLGCLSQDFRASEKGQPLIPRAGKCRKCGEMLLWGDLIKGCFRRQELSTADNCHGNAEDIGRIDRV